MIFSNLVKDGTAFLPRWFTIWFYITCTVFFVGGIADELTGKTTLGGLNLWGAALGVFLMYLLTLLMWRWRNALQLFFARIPLPLVMKSVLVGWFFAEIDELVNFPFNPLFPGVTLLLDIVATTIFYVLVHLCWFWVLSRYRFNTQEAFLIGGLTLGLFELFSGGVSILALLGIFIFPFLVMIHAVHMVMPKLALAKEFARENQSDTKWKYVIGVLVPAAGGAVGIGLMYTVGYLFLPGS